MGKTDATGLRAESTRGNSGVRRFVGRLSHPKPLFVLLVAAAACIAPIYIQSYLELEFTLAFGFAIACLGLNLSTGYTGQVSLGQSFFFAAGAFFTAWLVAVKNVEFLIALPIVAVLTFALGLIVAVPVVRLRGFNLALVTLALGLSATPLAGSLGFTGGNNGIIIPQFKALFDSNWSFGTFLYYIALILLSLCVWLMVRLLRGPAGRGIIGVRDREDVAAAMGVSVNWVKIRSFAASAGLAGIGGWVYCLAIGFVSPTSFPFILSVYILAGIVVGGMGSIVGSILGGLMVEFVPPWASSINEGAAGFAFGLFLILAVVFVPRGVVGSATSLWTRMNDWRISGRLRGQSGAPKKDDLPVVN
jgi:branched-chain amino acid transport system permease protein